MTISFGDTLPLCDRSPEDVARYLELIDDQEGAAAIRLRASRGQSLFNTEKFRIGAHQFGFVAPGGGGGPTTIIPAASLAPDQSLVEETIKLTLDRFKVEEYPGLGRHTILLELLGRSQIGSDSEDLRFASVLKVRDRDSAGVSGSPVFTGLRVPPDGLALDCRTISIRSDGDDLILDALQSSVFKDGLQLLALAQPALPQLVGLAGGVTASLLSRRKNAEVQRFSLGLDFSGSRTSVKLALGSYIIVQAPDDGSWRWDRWSYDPNSGAVVDGQGTIAPYNTIILGVSKCMSPNPQSGQRDMGSASAAVAAAPA